MVSTFALKCKIIIITINYKRINDLFRLSSVCVCVCVCVCVYSINIGKYSCI